MYVFFDAVGKKIYACATISTYFVFIAGVSYPRAMHVSMSRFYRVGTTSTPVFPQSRDNFRREDPPQSYLFPAVYRMRVYSIVCRSRQVQVRAYYTIDYANVTNM